MNKYNIVPMTWHVQNWNIYKVIIELFSNLVVTRNDFFTFNKLVLGSRNLLGTDRNGLTVLQNILLSATTLVSIFLFIVKLTTHLRCLRQAFLSLHILYLEIYLLLFIHDFLTQIFVHR